LYTFHPHVQSRSQASSEEIQWIYAFLDRIYNTLLKAAWHKDYISSGYPCQKLFGAYSYQSELTVACLDGLIVYGSLLFSTGVNQGSMVGTLI
jgi:hypothetical protein